MTNYEILTLLQNARKEMAELDSFRMQLRKLADRKDRVMELMVAIAAFDKQQATFLSSLQNELQQTRVELIDFSSRQFFESSLNLHAALRNLLMGLRDAERPTMKILNELNALQDAFDLYTRTHTSKAIMALIVHANAFVESLDVFDDYVDFISSAISTDQEPPEDMETFALYMPSTLTFQEFVSRLESIETIYDELCQILNVSASEEPLKIIKVESGSLWAKLFGNSKIMALMDDFLRETANYIRRNHTTEGKIGAIPTNLKTMDEVLEFSKKLKAEGIDVTEIHDQLAKSAVLIAKNMNNLFEAQSFVTINGDSIELNNGKNNLLESDRLPRLKNDLADD